MSIINVQDYLDPFASDHSQGLAAAIEAAMSPSCLLIHKQHRALVEALKRYGYTNQLMPSSGGFSGGHFYRDGCDLLMPCDAMKPYRLFIEDNDSLIILHGNCYHRSYEHSCEFLQAMIPIIGRLDALAHYEPGEKYKLGPRLRIYL